MGDAAPHGESAADHVQCLEGLENHGGQGAGEVGQAAALQHDIHADGDQAGSKKLQADQEQQERLKTLEWTDSEGCWVCCKWSPEQETLYLDQARKPVPQATFIEQLDKAMELVIRPENMPRFSVLAQADA